jgi:tetratricopeptide (TPR) repeat protein
MRLRRLLLFALLLFACTRHEKRVIFVGLDGADWRLLDRFVADGTMPRLGEILQRAERRVLLTQHPPLSPLVWTTMMTGVSPLRHRILDFTRYSPVTRQQEPITSDERAVPAIWNIATSHGKRVGVFGMWATYPAEPGVVLTDRDLPRDFVAATEFTHQRAAAWIRKQKPHLAIVYFQGTDEIGHFTAGDVEKSRAYFHRIDEILGDYRALAEQLDAELVVASDHGFDWGGKHDESSTATATAAKWHRNEGVYLRWPRERSVGVPVGVGQICAMLLEMLDLRPGGAAGSQPAGREAKSDGGLRARRSTGDEEAVAKLKALGYIGSTAGAPKNATGTRTPQSYNNEGLILRESGRIEAAESAFMQALALDSAYASARQNLDDLLAARGVERLKAGDCRGALADLRHVTRQSALLWASIAAAEGCLGHDRAAEEAVRHSLAINPNQPELRRLVD